MLQLGLFDGPGIEEKAVALTPEFRLDEIAQAVRACGPWLGIFADERCPRRSIRCELIYMPRGIDACGYSDSGAIVEADAFVNTALPLRHEDVVIQVAAGRGFAIRFEPFDLPCSAVEKLTREVSITRAS